LEIHLGTKATGGCALVFSNTKHTGHWRLCPGFSQHQTQWPLAALPQLFSLFPMGKRSKKKASSAGSASASASAVDQANKADTCTVDDIAMQARLLELEASVADLSKQEPLPSKVPEMIRIAVEKRQEALNKIQHKFIQAQKTLLRLREPAETESPAMFAYVMEFLKAMQVENKEQAINQDDLMFQLFDALKVMEAETATFNEMAAVEWQLQTNAMFAEQQDRLDIWREQAMDEMVRLREENALLHDKLASQANQIKTLEQFWKLEKMRRQLTEEAPTPSPAPSTLRFPHTMIRSLSETVLGSGRTREASAERLLRARGRGDLPAMFEAAQEMAEWRVRREVLGSLSNCTTCDCNEDGHSFELNLIQRSEQIQ